jgi:superfamily II DNA or RNA helicase
LDKTKEGDYNYLDNIVNITKRDDLNIKIETDDYDYIKLLKAEFEYLVEGYNWMPAFRSGRWNGRTCLIRGDNSLPYGLLTELMRVNKTSFPRVTLRIDEDVKSIFKGDRLRLEETLSLKPYPYQKDCIVKALQYTKGIIRSATASGKSLVIAYILKTLLDNKKIKQGIIIVPNRSLVEQFYNDLQEYGVKYSIGRVHGKSKEWNEEIVISTWQTLMRNHNKLKQYDAVIVDECHGGKSFELKKILVKAINADYRLGFTGTLHAGKLDNLNTQSYLGPVIADYSSGFLAEEGYISKCNVKVVNIEYETQFEGDYNVVKDEVFTNQYRLNVIKKIVNQLDHNVLILVGKVEKEGDYLKNWLQGVTKKEIVFLSGRDNTDEREKWRKACMKRKDIILIATYGIFAQGINIPNLKYIVFGSPFMSKIRVLQSIGRALRKHANKKEGATIYDIHDHVKYLKKHGNVRFRYYGTEGFETEEILLEEGNNICMLKPN